LADIKDLVLGETEFVVIDKKSGTDITRCILLQVISDQEQNGDAILTEGFLAQVIRSYGLDAPAITAEHLEQNLRQFMAQRRMASAGEMVNPFPAEAKNSLTSGP
jgi:polyhydroxyalkanoate synthesis repressor PhaR